MHLKDKRFQCLVKNHSTSSEYKPQCDFVPDIILCIYYIYIYIYIYIYTVQFIVLIWVIQPSVSPHVGPSTLICIKIKVLKSCTKG